MLPRPSGPKGNSLNWNKRGNLHEQQPRLLRASHLANKLVNVLSTRNDIAGGNKQSKKFNAEMTTIAKNIKPSTVVLAGRNKIGNSAKTQYSHPHNAALPANMLFQHHSMDVL